jgi:hypothetical protein
MINILASFAAYKLTLDKIKVANYYYNHLIETELLNIEVIRCVLNKVIHQYVNASFTTEAIKKPSKVDRLNLIQKRTNVIYATIDESRIKRNDYKILYLHSWPSGRRHRTHNPFSYGTSLVRTQSNACLNILILFFSRFNCKIVNKK